MKQKVYIRADGSSDIGLGHIVRCISLAHMLKDDFSIHFFSLKIPNSLKNEIIQNQWGITEIEKESDFLNELSLNEMVVLDGYQFDSNYHKEIKNKGSKLICIDDFHNQHFIADLVINHAPGVSEEDYDGESYTKYLLGPDYALLRPEFLNGKMKKRSNENEGEIKNIFICFGGSDAKNLTAMVLSWLPSENYLVTVVLGNAYSHLSELNKVIVDRRDLEVSVKNSLSAKEMIGELEKADLAILPSSGISLEAFMIGVPTIVGHFANNQFDVYTGLISKKGFYGASNFSKANFLNALDLAKKNYQLPKQINPSNISNSLRSEFNKLKDQIELKPREVTEDDIDVLFEWANDPVTRLNSFSEEKIDYANHIEWVNYKLNCSECVFLIFENAQNQKIGFVRFDKEFKNNWIISINIASFHRGKGYSVELLRRGVSYFISVRGHKLIKAFIKKENIASKKAFERVGFIVQEEINVKGIESILMVWK